MAKETSPRLTRVERGIYPPEISLTDGDQRLRFTASTDSHTAEVLELPLHCASSR